MEEEKKRNYVTNYFEAGSNSQVFTGPVNGCVFAMPGSTVIQKTEQPTYTNVKKETLTQNHIESVKKQTDTEEANQSITNITALTLSASRQYILDQLLDLADKGEWVRDITAEDIKTMLKTVLGLGETSLAEREAGMSETLWYLLENGRGERVKIVWQNLIGYFVDRKLLPSRIGAPALNKMFFSDDSGYTNIDKGRPSKGLMTADFESLLPLLDAYVPTVG